MIEWFDEAAKRRFDFERCYADVAAIAALLPHADELRSAIVANWRADPLASVVIADASGDAEVMRAGARALWDAGLGDALRELLLP